MKIVVPLAYTVRGIPKRGHLPRDTPVVELIERDLREIAESDAPIGVVVSVSERVHGSTRRDDIALRWFDKGFIRHASETEYNFASPLKRHELPVWRGGQIHSNYIVGFLGLMPLVPNGTLYLQACELMEKGGTARTNVDPAEKFREILASDREEALARTEKSLSSLVLVGDTLWQRSSPNWVLAPFPGFTHAWLGYGGFQPKETHPCLPLGDYRLLEAAAEFMGGPLLADGHVKYVADWLELDTGPLSPTTKAARDLLEDTARRLGEYPQRTAIAWMDLRDAIASGDHAGIADIRECIDIIVDSLGEIDEAAVRRARRQLEFVDAVYGVTPAVSMRSAPRRSL